MSASASDRRARQFVVLAVAYCLVALLVRAPMLYNASPLFEDDEAANALSVKHLLEGKAALLFYYGQRYQGLTEGLAALPFVAVFGWHPLAFMLSPLLAWTGTVLIIGRWIYRRWGLVWLGAWFVLQSFVPVFSLWSSTQAIGGHVWVTFFAVASFYLCAKGPLSGSRWLQFFLLQVVGAYTYSYYALLLPLTCFAAVRAGNYRIREWVKAAAVCILVVGIILVLRTLADRIQPDHNCYPDFWRLDRQIVLTQLQDRWFVLRRQCLPLVFSAEGACHAFTRLNASFWFQAVGPDGLPAIVEEASRFVFPVQLAFFLGAVLVAVFRVLRPTRSDGFVEMVVLAGMAACVAFVLFRYGEQWSRVRYLTPVYPAATLGALWLARLAIEHLTPPDRPLLRVLQTGGFTLLTLSTAYFAIIDYSYYRKHEMIGTGLELRRIQTFRSVLADWCTAQGLSGMVAYGDYRVAYPVAFLTKEAVRVCPYDLRRIPSYAREAEQLPLPWFFGLEFGPRGTPPGIRGVRYQRFAELPAPPFRVVIWKPLAVLSQEPNEGVPARPRSDMPR